MRAFRKLLISIFLFVCIFLPSCPAYASAKKITEVNLSVTGKPVVGKKIDNETLSISGSSAKFYIDSYMYDNGGFEWSITDTPEVAITLSPEAGYYFAISKAAQIHLSGATFKSAEFSNYGSESDDPLVIYATLAPLADSQVGSIENVTLGEDGRAKWDASEGAGSYEVFFRRGSANIGGKMTETATADDFGKLIRGAGTYSFRVRAVNKKDPNVGSPWKESNTIVLTEEEAQKLHEDYWKNSKFKWTQSGKNWTLTLPDGKKAVSSWQFVRDQWYYLGADGYMKTGWQQVGPDWYYLDPDSGAMWKNRKTPDGYQVGIDGRWGK